MRPSIAAAAVALAVQLVPFATRAQGTDDGSCDASAGPLDEVLGVVESLPTPDGVVDDASPRVTLCDGVPVVAFDENLEGATVTVRVPLAKLDTRPLSAGAFAAEIAHVDVPAPWSFGETTWRLDGEGDSSVLVLVLTGENSNAASAWAQTEGHVHIRLKSGQTVIPRIAFGSIVRDTTAHFHARLRRQIEYRERRIGELTTLVGEAQATVAAPGSIVTGEEDAIAEQRAWIADLETRVAARFASAKDAFDRADEVGRVASLSSAAGDFPASQPAVSAYLAAHNARALAAGDLAKAEELLSALREGAPGTPWPEQEAAVLAARDALAAAQARVPAARDAAMAKAQSIEGMMDRVYERFDAFHRQPGETALTEMNGDLGADRRWLETLIGMDARKRADTVSRAQSVIAETPAVIAGLEAERDELRRRLDGGETERDVFETRYGAACPAG